MLQKLKCVALCSIFGLLSACAKTEPAPVINTNQFIQTNYDFNCLDGTKTFTQIILCYQEQDDAEKAQNNITNKLINKKPE